MKIKMSKLRQLIKEASEYNPSTIFAAMEKIAALLPVECYAYGKYPVFNIFVGSMYTRTILLQYSANAHQGESDNTLFFGEYGADFVSDEWIIEQSNCESFDQVDHRLKNAVEILLQDELAVLKDNADYNVDLD